MQFKFADLLRASGTIDRGTYALAGFVGFALKHNLDRMIAAYAFHRPWTVFNYMEPVRDVGRITELRGDEAQFLETMVTLALPFIWVGVVLTLKRLRGAGMPPWLVVLFFVPFLNLLFFAFLCVAPARQQASTKESEGVGWLTRLVPESALGSAATAVLITVPIGLGITMLGVQVLRNYGWGVFVALPFTMGFAAAMIYGIREPRSRRGCIGVASLSVGVLGGALLALAFEGFVCLMMAAPIALPLAAAGGELAYWAQRWRWAQRDATAFLGVALLFVPGVQWTEHVTARPAPVYAVRTAIEVHAPAERVWKQVVAFSEIGPPEELMFRAGIAYPIRAEMVGTGAGAERHCVFSTGAFVEPIKVWDEPRLLTFSVTSNPPPMEEWTPYSHIEPPHLHGFLESEGGQFLLTPLPDGGTRLEGTTWYRHSLWPAEYWRIWSDAIIHRIHLRVLRHIRDEAEKQL